jgi:glycerophosphoryl diester phosphodiesterase
VTPPLLRLVVAAGLGCCLIASAAPSAPAAVSDGSGRTFLVLAHRGDGWDAPENSVEAFRAAGAAGYDGVETDIQFSADHVPVLSHSDSLRPGKATGSDCTPAMKIHKSTWAQLRTVRCIDQRTRTYTVPLATFDQLAEVLKAHPALQLTLDIKKYSDASPKTQRDYARRSAELIIANDLVPRTRILTYNWDAMLATLRKHLPKTYVLAYDYSDFSYSRVRLAKKLKASAYGAEARFTSVNLAAFVRAKKLDLVPWNQLDAPDATQAAAFALTYGPKEYWFLTDDPAGQKAALTAGTAKLKWSATSVTTRLSAPVRVDKGTYEAGRYRYPKVLGTALPAATRFNLKTVRVSLTVSGGKKGNYAYVGAKGADGSARTKVKLPKGTGTVQVSVPVGDAGRIRVKTTKKSKLTVQVVASTKVVFS